MSDPLHIISTRIGDLIPNGRDRWMTMCPSHDDKKRSLSVRRLETGKILLHCFAGCSFDHVCQAAGINPADLFADGAEETKPKHNGNVVVAQYDYKDEAGVLVNQVLRFEPKAFKQRRPDGNGGWIYNLEGVRRVVYRLPELKGQKAVILVEGEKDADALWSLGLPATTTLGGSSAWRDEYAGQLKAAGVERVVVIPDNDDAGRAYGAKAAAACHVAGMSVRVLGALPGVRAKGDVSDFLALPESSKEVLIRLCKEAPEWAPETQQQQPEAHVARGWRKGTELDPTPITYLVDGMVPARYFGAIAGRDKRGKSLLGLEIAKSVLTGEPLFGEFPVKTGSVYLMLLDDPENLVRTRLSALGILDHPNLFVKTRNDVDLNHPLGILDQLADDCDAAKPTFLLIDALYCFVPEGKNGSDQANSGSAMGPIMRRFDDLCERNGTTVGLVIHSNKADTDLTGSQVVRNMLKWVLFLTLPKKYEKDKNKGRITADRILQLDKLKTGASQEWGLRICSGDTPGSVRWERVDIAELEKKDKKEKTQKREEEREEAVAWARFFLEPGPRTSTEVFEAALEAKVRRKVLESKDFMDAAEIEKYHPTPDGPWLWRLKEAAQ